MSEPQNDELGHRIAHAIADRRREPARGFEERLRAAALKPARVRWLLPAIAATAVAAMAIAVVFVWRGRADDEAQLAELPRLEVPRPPVGEDAPPVTIPPVSPPAGPVLRAGTIDFFEGYQTVIDGDTSGLGLDAAQTTRIRRIVDDYKRVLINHLDEQIRANGDLQAEYARTDPDTGVMLGTYDRALAAESAARRAMMAARIAVRAALTPAQRKLVERRPIAPTVSSAPTPPAPAPTPTPTPAPAYAQLKIQTHPTGAEITVDGALRGMSPLALRLAHGRHVVRVNLEGHQLVERVIEITEDTTLRYALQVDPATAGTGTLRVIARPYAEIFVDGKAVGTTPIVVNLTAGMHRVVAGFADGSKETRTIDIRDGVASTLSLSRPPPASTGSGGSASGIKNPFDDGF